MHFCCASIAAPIPEIHLLDVCKCAQCNFEKQLYMDLLLLRQVFCLVSVLVYNIKMAAD